MAACQSLPDQPRSTSDRETYTEPSPKEMFGSDQAIAETNPPKDLWERIRRQMTWQKIHNQQVGQARDHYLRQPNYLPVVSERASLYLHYIVEEVEKRDIPIELALLPLVESTLNPFAVSSESAAGLWQIMPATGRWLGLYSDWWYDGRRDLRASTDTALDYLESLHKEFDEDWMLALAAYNAGKGRVGRARRANEKQGLPTDYWSLKLPRETRHYVPRLLALTQIVAFPEAFDVEIPPVANAPAFEIGNTGGQIELARAASLAGIDLNMVQALNPGQLRWATSPETAPELLLPLGSAAAFHAGVAQLTDADRVRWEHYRIESGDNLIRIARKFDTEVELLRQVNDIRGSMIRAGDTLMIPQGSDWATSLAMADRSNDEPTRRGYRVRRGDSLYRIAGRFKISVHDIIAWNSLDPNAYLQPGQRLTLYVSGG
ncbi:LysM peptidoglycan-binding domain-containing protein [Halioglobus maricola]|uniref:LysM peptidoglycan-binding domain-containing protein n=1 Tax=Halioglobus maricola TaxID=2601894 RepID=UPI001F0F5413|nr:LysM peptidoglycan-binding domain-containing protein [Halioglobus maricola]